MMKSFIQILSILYMAGSFLHAQEAKLVDEEFLSSLRSEAVKNHPAAISAKNLATAAASDIRSVRLWEDPMVGLSLMAADQMMRRDDGDIRIGFEQPLPKPGMFAANIAKAEALHRSQVENSRSAALEVGTAAAMNVIELALADESILLQIAQIHWLDSMLQNARQKALNPDATSIEALRLESELAREKQILEAARRTRESLSNTLNLRLGRPLESSWPLLKLTAAPLPVRIPSAEIARIPYINPKVRAMKELASAANAEKRIAERDRLPQLSLTVDSELYSGGDFRSASVGLKMSLPFFNHQSYDAKIESALLREKAAVGDIETTRLEIAKSVLASATAAANAAAQANAYSGEIYQRALSATQAVEASWISSKSTLTDLLDANRMLFSIRLEQRRFVAMQLVANQELDQLVPQRR